MDCLVVSAVIGAHTRDRCLAGSSTAQRNPTWCFTVYNGLEAVCDSLTSTQNGSRCILTPNQLITSFLSSFPVLQTEHKFLTEIKK